MPVVYDKSPASAAGPLPKYPLEETPQLSPEMSGLLQEARTPDLTKSEKAGLLISGFGHKAKDMLISMGIRGSSQKLGETLGRRFGGKPGERLGGGAGALVGNLIDQGRLIATDKQPQGFSFGDLGGDIVSGLLARNSTKGMPAKGRMLGRAIDGGSNVVAANVQSFLDDKGLLSAGQNAEAYNTAVMMGHLGDAMDKGKGARATRIAEMEGEPFRRVISEGRDLGLVLPPPVTNKLGVIKGLHILGGGADIIGTAKELNSPKIVQAVRDELKFRPGEVMDMNALETKAALTNLAWDKVAAVNPATESLMNQFKAFNAHSNRFYEAYNTSETKMPGTLAKAKLWEKQADKAASRLKRALAAAQQPTLYDEFNAARVRRAQIELTKEALSPGGHINPDVFGNAIEANRPLTGNFRAIGNFQSEFNKYVANQRGLPGSNNVLSLLTAHGPAALAGGAVAGAPGAFVAGATVPPLVKYGMLSQFAQDRILEPHYGSTRPDALAQMAKFGTTAEARREIVNAPPEPPPVEEEQPVDLTDEEAQRRYEELLAKKKE